MRNLIGMVLAVGLLFTAVPLEAQQTCPASIVVAGSPEDALMTAVSGASDPQGQVAALDQYAQAHADSKFMSCVDEYYTLAYLKLNNYPKAIEYGKKALAIPYQDTMILLNLTKAYVGAGQATPEAFSVISKAPAEIKKEEPSRVSTASNAEWQKTVGDYAAQMKDIRAYEEYAFFALLPRVTDANQRIKYLDAFGQAYPGDDASELNFAYFAAYKGLNNIAKADEYGDKAIAADPNNVQALNLVAFDYAFGRTNPSKAATYARKVLELAPALKKPANMTDEQFSEEKDTQLGLAHLTLGYIDFLNAGRTRRVSSAEDEFKSAIGLLKAQPAYQAQALYFLGNAYEFQSPPNHHLAAEVLTRAAGMESPWQGQARELLAKVKHAER
ncbi:MAG: hypothetical protein ACRD3T_02430 [Terriglobia bacterium]